jgi:excinuclease UvrABC nuclease subunit
MYVGIVEQNTAGRTAINRLQEHLREKASEFLGDASSIEIKGVGLEVREARSLEDDLITDLKPKWNKRERDPQSYSRKYQAEPVAEEVSGAGNISLRFEIGMR